LQNDAALLRQELALARARIHELEVMLAHKDKVLQELLQKNDEMVSKVSIDSSVE